MSNPSFYIAKSYFLSKKKKNIVHFLTRITVFGVAITTAALLVLIAAFNGIETMVEKLYSAFDSDITFTPKNGKSFEENTLNIKSLKKDFTEIQYVSFGIHEIGILQHQKKWINSKIIAYDDDFLNMVQLDQHLLDEQKIKKNGIYIGAGLLDKLGAYITKDEKNPEQVNLYVPKRNAKIGNFNNPFRTERIDIHARFNYNKEINDEVILIPIQMVQNLLQYEGKIHSIEIKLKNKKQLASLQNRLKEKYGKTFEIKSHFEKNELIYKTSKSEKLIVIGILIFVFILAAVNLVASLIMIYVEKKEHLVILKVLGFNFTNLSSLFHWIGFIIAGIGVLSGLILGIIIILLQQKFSLILLPNSNGEAFPIDLNWFDIPLVFVIVSIISILATRITTRFLMKNFKNHYE